MWKPEYCTSCPVPEILMANACPHLILQPRIERTLPLFKRQVKVTTFCTKTMRDHFDPHIGCGECHKLMFQVDEERP
jgi:hypothetical protein